jgi:hypothetical protein
VSQRQWHATQLDGTVYAVEPQQTIEITPGLRVDLRPGLVAVPG